MEVGGVDPSSLRHPGSGYQGRLRASRRIHAARPSGRSNDRAQRVSAPCSTPPTMTRPAFRRVSLEVGGVEPPSPGAYHGRLQVCPAIWVVEEGVADRRASPLVSRLVSPGPFGQEPGLASVGYEPYDRSRRRDRGPVVIGAYAARAKLPLLLAIKSLPNQEIGGSTCNPRYGPLGSRPEHPRWRGRNVSNCHKQYTRMEDWGQARSWIAFSMIPPPRTYPASS